MSFHPAGAPIPQGTRSARLVLRPLRATDAEVDYDAVMSSAPMLRRWSQSSWPADDFTLAENRADLERHEREHEDGSAFTFTALDPTGSGCVGCIYLVPPDRDERALAPGARHAVRVSFWVRTAEIANDLDRHLLAVLREWLANAWAFDVALFAVSEAETRQASLLREAGLVEAGLVELEDGRRRRIFREAQAGSRVESRAPLRQASA